MKELMELMNLRSPSGHEEAIRAYLMKKIRPHCKNMKVDNFGNLIVHKKGKGPKVLLAAHMDEIGLLVQSISNAGIMKVALVGYIDPLAVINLHVKIHTKKKGKIITGVVTTLQQSHFLEVEEVPVKSDLIVDTGLNKKELIKIGVNVGSFIEFSEAATTLGSKNHICGKAVDDRAGCYILLQLIRECKKSNVDIYYVFTVQEEIGLYGAKTSVYNLDPEWAVVIDVTSANDTEENAQNITRALGKGPTLTVMDAEIMGNTCLNNNIQKVAKKLKLPVQLDVSEEGTTDALNISLSKGGIPTTVFGVAVRNLHTSIGIVHKKDIENTIKILKELVSKPPKICL